MTVLEYMARFTELAHFADDYVAIDLAKVRRFPRITGTRLRLSEPRSGLGLSRPRSR